MLLVEGSCRYSDVCIVLLQKTKNKKKFITVEYMVGSYAISSISQKNKIVEKMTNVTVIDTCTLQ